MTARALSNRVAGAFATFAFTAAAATLAGCGGSANLVSAGSPGQQSPASSARQPLEARLARSPLSGSTLYAAESNDSAIAEYNLPSGTAIGTIPASSGLIYPLGLFVSQKQLYVANGDQVLVFPAGQTTPSFTYQEGASFEANDLAVGTDGTVYVANFAIGYDEPGDVVVFKAGQKFSSYSIEFPGQDPVISDTLDANNDLYVAYLTGSNSARINEYAPGAQKGTNTGFSVKHPGGMAFDKNGNLVVVDGTTIDVFAPGTAQPVRTFGTLQQGQFLAFNKARTLLYVSDSGANQVDKFNYKTGKLKGTIAVSSSGGAAGLAIDPPAL